MAPDIIERWKASS